MLIALCGRARSGKDLSGARLVNELGFIRIGLADAVKEFAAALFEWDENWVKSEEFKLTNVLAVAPQSLKSAPVWSGRALLQHLGTEAGRKVFGEDCWVDLALKKCRDATKNYVITDLRFKNELDAIQRVGGKVIRLNRADRGLSHTYKIGPWGPDSCGYTETVTGPGERQCRLFVQAHPSHYSGDTHPSEVSLPDESNETIKYDAVIEAPSGEGAADRVRTLVGSWLA